MSITCTISNVAVSVGNASFSLEDPLESRSILTFTVLDSAGSAVYTRGEPVTFADPDIGMSYIGYVQSDAPTKDGIVLPFVEHVITCMDGVYNLGKRSNSTNYLNWQAGNIAIDFVRRDLAAEGITIAAAMHRDQTASDFNQGNLSGTVGAVTTANGVSDDGDLELTPAGSAVTITENTTANFSTGTLTNVVASANTLSPTTESAIQMTTQLPVAISPAVLGTTYIYMDIWSGSQVVGTLDTLNYDIWIDASSPAFNCGVDLNFSDSTTLHSYTGPVDQNAYPASTQTDLGALARGTWYTRNIGLTSALNGKTVTSVTIGVTGLNAGTYTLYVRNCYLSSHSGTPFFSTSATATNVNPATVYSSFGYIPALTFISVVQAIAGAVANRVSPSYSISAVQLVASSLVTWSVTTPSSSVFQLAVSYDGNAFIPCTNGQPLPGLPPGSKVSGVSLYFMQIFTPGTEPTALPTLFAVTVQINPAPAATKSDIVTSYGTSAQWNAGTLNYLAPNSNGDLTLGTILRDWNDNLITNQDFFTYTLWAATQAATGGAYQITCTASNTGFGSFGLSRLNFAGILTDFTAEWDQSTTVTGSVPRGAIGLTYRTVGWASGFDANYGYLFWMNVGSGTTPSINLGYGSNRDTPGTTAGTLTTLQTATGSYTSGTTYHIKLVVVGNNHQVFINHASTPTLNVNDAGNTYAVGSIGWFAEGATTTPSGGTDTMVFDNLVITPASSGTWTSPSASLSSLTTIAGSIINWLETLASGTPSATAIVQASIDGGTTFQTCTQNTTIPGLTAGVNVSSKSLIIKITLYANSIASEPIIQGLNWRVLGAFPTVTGTRNTAPVGNDMSITRTVGSGWGNAFDGQPWTQVGTGTTAVGSGEATISATTGTVYMRLGTLTGTDLEGTHRFSLSSSAETAGIFLRYVDANNYYALAATTSAVFILKRLAGVTTTLASVSMAQIINTAYRMHFRVDGSAPVLLFGNVWLDGTREPTVDAIGQWDDSQWIITAID